MAKIKIGDLAKELGVENKAVIAYLQEQGVTSAKVWNSSIEEDEALLARRHFGAGEAPAEEKKAAAKKPVAKDALAAAGDRHLSRPRQRTRSAGGEHRPGCRGLFPDRLSSRRSAQPA